MLRLPRRFHRYAAPAVLLAAVLAGCSGGSAGSEDPGRAAHGSGHEHSSSSSPAPSTAHADEADVRFMQMMIPHHAQAVEMTKLAAERAVTPPVKRIAARIKAAQGPEITLMSRWLKERGEDVPSGHAMHKQMDGMLSPAQMSALRKAHGRTFDRLFLRGMIQHHQGALMMARTERSHGHQARALELADHILSSQAREIATMKRMLKHL